MLGAAPASRAFGRPFENVRCTGRILDRTRIDEDQELSHRLPRNQVKLVRADVHVAQAGRQATSHLFFAGSRLRTRQAPPFTLPQNIKTDMSLFQPLPYELLLPALPFLF